MHIRITIFCLIIFDVLLSCNKESASSSIKKRSSRACAEDGCDPNVDGSSEGGAQDPTKTGDASGGERANDPNSAARILETRKMGLDSIYLDDTPAPGAPDDLFWAFPEPLNTAPLHLPGRDFTGMASCPFDSVLVGHESDFFLNMQDRSFKLKCQSLIDGLGRRVIKHSCVTTFGFANDFGKRLNFECSSPDLFISGQESAFGEEQMDRKYRFECCKLKTADEKPISFIETPVEGTSEKAKDCQPLKIYQQHKDIQDGRPDPESNSMINGKGEFLYFHCPKDYLLNRIKGEYRTGADSWLGRSLKQSDARDRQFSYQCCRAGIEGKPGPAAATKEEDPQE